MSRKDRHAIVVSAVTYDALISLSKYRETMDDVIRRLIKSYAGVSHIDLEERRRFFTNGRKPAK